MSNDEILYEFKTIGGDNVAQSFRGISNAEKEAAQAAKTLATEQAGLAIAFKKAEQSGKDFNINLAAGLAGTAIAIGAIVNAIGAVTSKLTDFYGNAIKNSVAFQEQIKKIGVITEESGTQSIKDLTAEIERLGIATTKTPVDIANAAREFTKAGFSATEAKEAIAGIVQASEATGESLNKVGDITAKTIRQFGLAATDSQRVADLLVEAANKSNVDISSLGEALRYVGADAKASNQSIEGTVAVLALLGDAGLQGSIGGTSLAAALRQLKIGSAEVSPQLENLVRGSKKAREAFQELQVEFRNSDGTLKDLASKLPELKARLSNLAPGERDIITQALFGTQGSRAILAAISQSEEKIKSLTSSLQDSSGAAAKASAELTKGLGGALVLLNSSLTLASQKIGDLVGTGLEPATRGLTEFINTFIPKFSEITETLAPELVAQGKAFADELNRSPELADSLAKSLAEASATLEKELLIAAEELVKFLNENPTAISDAITGIANLLKGTAELAKSALDAVNLLVKAKEGLDAGNTFTDKGRKLTPEEVGIRRNLNPEDRKQFDARAIDNQEGQGLFYDPKAAEKVYFDIQAKRRKFNQDELKASKEFNAALLENDILEGVSEVKGVEQTGRQKVEKTRAAEGLIAQVKKEKVKTEAEIQAAQLKAIKDGNTQAEEAIKSSVDRQIATTKLKKLSAEAQAVAIAQIEIDSTKKSIAQTELEIIAAKNAGEQKKISATEATALISKLNKELSAETLTLADKEAAADKAKTALKIKNLTEAFDKQKVQNESQQQANQLETAAIDIQVKALESKRGIEKAISDQRIAGLEAEKAKLEENGASVEAIAAKQKEIVAAKRTALLQEQVFQRSSLELDIKRNDLAAQLGILKAQEVKLQADLNLSKLVASKADAAQLSIAQKIVDNAQAQVNGAIAAKDSQTALNAEARQTLAINQKTAQSQFDQTNAVKATTAATGDQKTGTEKVGVAIDANTEKLKLQNAELEKAAASAKEFQDRLNKAGAALQNTRVGFAGSNGEGSNISAIKTVDSTVLRLEELNLLKELAETDKARAEIQSEIDAIQKSQQEDKLSKLEKEIRLNKQLLEIQRMQAVGDFSAANRGLEALTRPGQIPGFAEGVQNFGGGFALVGERGPELVKLPRGSDVIPNGRFGGETASNRGIESRLDKLIGMSNRPGTLIVSSPNPTSDAADIYQNLDRMSASRAGVGR